MARPRIFISSTFYDLRQVRSDIERSIRELGYEPIRHETGVIPYSKDEPLESGAYREIELSDVIVFVTGGRFGSQSDAEPSCSISQVELKRALESGIPVFIFVENAVFNEYNTYQLNKDANIHYSSVDDTRVFEFLEELYLLPSNNPITPFEVAGDITNYLREQFAGLFHRFLQEQKRLKELRVLDEMNATAKTLKELVGFLTKERNNSDEAIKSILLANHPAFRRLRQLTRNPYRVFFTTRKEMEAWLKARNWEQVPANQYDPESTDEWMRSPGRPYLKFTRDIFDEENKLLPFMADDWNDDWISLVSSEPFEEEETPF